MNARTAWIAVFSAAVLSLAVPASVTGDGTPGGLPDGTLLDRGGGWESQYKSAAEFQHAEKSIRAFVNEDHPDNEWNRITKKNQITIYNFNTMAGQRDAGLNALLAYVQEQKRSGTYDPSEAERRFHEWAEEGIPDPVMPANVRLALVDRVVEAYGESVNLGYVPTELLRLDAEFWMNLVSYRMCEFTAGCDPNPGSFDPDRPDCSLVPCAEAVTYSMGHILTAMVEPLDCFEVINCLYTSSTFGIGRLTVSAVGSTLLHHSERNLLDYYIHDESYVDTYNLTHEISGTAYLGSSGSKNLGPKTGINSVTLDDIVYVPAPCRDHCGTYSLSATAENVTFEV